MVSQLVWFIVVIVSIIIAFFLSRMIMKMINKRSVKKLIKESGNNPDFLMDSEGKKEVQGNKNETWKETKSDRRLEELERRLEELERRLEDERENLRDIRERGRGLEVPRPDREDIVGREQPIETTDNPDEFEGRRNLPTESSSDIEGHKRKFKWD